MKCYAKAVLTLSTYLSPRRRPSQLQKRAHCICVACARRFQQVWNEVEPGSDSSAVSSRPSHSGLFPDSTEFPGVPDLFLPLVISTVCRCPLPTNGYPCQHKSCSTIIVRNLFTSRTSICYDFRESVGVPPQTLKLSSQCFIAHPAARQGLERM
jgi:hypothetical protein